MPRNTVDACMFCGHVHSGNCGGTPPKPKLSKVERVRPGKTSPAEKTAASPAQSSAPSEVGSATPAPERERQRPNLAAVQRVRDPEEEQLARAITLFAERDMLGADSLREHRKYIRLPDVKIDAMIWKEANRDVVQGATQDLPPRRPNECKPAVTHRDRDSPGLP